MPRVHSHYENLKLQRDARPDAIRAAYRALSRQHHPDRNPDNADASRVMSVINVAYEVLSDPVRKREHDRWIARAESEAAGAGCSVVWRTWRATASCTGSRASRSSRCSMTDPST